MEVPELTRRMVSLGVLSPLHGQEVLRHFSCLPELKEYLALHLQSLRPAQAQHLV
jgi:hypothetical protein